MTAIAQPRRCRALRQRNLDQPLQNSIIVKLQTSAALSLPPTPSHLHALDYNLGNLVRKLVMETAEGGGVSVGDELVREADQDGRQGQKPRALHHVSVDRWGLGNDEVTPKPAVRLSWVERVKPTHSGPSAFVVGAALHAPLQPYESLPTTGCIGPELSTRGDYGW
jgi:hypothetical protein